MTVETREGLVLLGVKHARQIALRLERSYKKKGMRNTARGVRAVIRALDRELEKGDQ